MKSDMSMIITHYNMDGIITVNSVLIVPRKGESIEWGMDTVIVKDIIYDFEVMIISVYVA